MILTGDNLGERHREINTHVNEAVAKQTNFENLRLQPEQHDVDKIFKIDVASKYKEIDYILEVLKCGDVFYIARALKCLWLYTDEYSQFINTAYLEKNIFSSMSEKMKRKMLTFISIHMTNPDRAIDFYEYCKEAKLHNYTVKFLVKTPVTYKLDLFTNCKDFTYSNFSKLLKQFVGNSFDIFEACLRLCGISNDLVYKLRDMYSISDVDYLNVLEKHIQPNPSHPYCLQRLGIRISRDILKRHRKRIINTPVLYLNILNKTMLEKYLTAEDVKSFTSGLLPSCSRDFWYMNFYRTYKQILEKIPKTELFGHLKQKYTTKYKDEAFELRIEFYELKYYEMLDIDEREAWALRQLERDKEFRSIKNYEWYKFISYQKASSGIKRYIYMTPDKDERSRIVNIMPETARNMEDVNKILSYYYERHVNESEEHKESFINKIFEHHDIYSFSDECWISLDKLLYSLDVYTTTYYTKAQFKCRSLFYYILQNKELPEALKECIDCVFCGVQSIIEQLAEERKIVITKYLFNYYADEIKCLMEHPDYATEKAEQGEDIYLESGNISDKIHGLVTKIWSIIDSFKRAKEDCPQVALEFMEAHKEFYSDYHPLYKTQFVKIHEEDFVRWLKHDKEKALDGIYDIRCNTYRWNFRLSRLFRKLKVYFPNDVGKEYLDYFIEYLSDIPGTRREYRNIKMAVVGVFYLADSNFIITFLEKYSPAAPKIDHRKIDNKLFQVQKAICRLAYHARPPLPLCHFQKFIIGDYVHFCLPVIYNYFANLQSNENFIETLLDTPLSIQKHGLRLAFRAYNTNKLIPIIKSAWMRTKNVSLRMLLYETLFNKIVKENAHAQKELYEVLKMYTSEIDHNDQDIIFSLLVSDEFPINLKGDFIEVAWLSVSKLSNKHVDIKRKISVIWHMEKYLHLVRRDFPRIQIINNHVKEMLLERRIHREHAEDAYKELNDAKWNLTAKYIVTFADESEQKKSLELLQTIISLCIKSWNIGYRKQGIYTMRKFMQDFINMIKHKDPKTVDSCARSVLVYQHILDNLKTFVNKAEIYLLKWELQLSITCRNIIHSGRKQVDSGSNEPSRYMSDKEIAVAYGKEVGEMVITSIENEEFYYCFYESLANIISNIGCTISNIISSHNNGVVYNVCDVLTDFQITETHVLALLMLPTDPSYYWRDEHKQSLKKLKRFKCEEVRSFLYKKYVMSDCVVRRYVK